VTLVDVTSGIDKRRQIGRQAPRQVAQAGRGHTTSGQLNCQWNSIERKRYVNECWDVCFTNSQISPDGSGTIEE
jgi:hypothetical protein